MQFKPVLSKSQQYSITTSMAKIKKSHNTKCWQGCKVTGILTLYCYKCKLVQSLQREIGEIFIHLSIYLSYDLTVSKINENIYKKTF